jgi:hypothetical protein
MKLSKEIIKFLQHNIKKRDVVFEYGAFITESLCEFANHVFTVETDVGIFEDVAEKINVRHIENSTMICVEHDNSGKYASRSRYVGAVMDFPDKTFRLICIGDLAASACITAALPKLRDAGFIVLHGIKPETREDIEPVLFGFERVLNSGETAIWRKA